MEHSFSVSDRLFLEKSGTEVTVLSKEEPLSPWATAAIA